MNIADAMIEDAMIEAEEKAWRSLAGYKFWMFGYHAAQWVLLNRLDTGRIMPNPFRALVKLAKQHVAETYDKAKAVQQATTPELSERMRKMTLMESPDHQCPRCGWRYQCFSRRCNGRYSKMCPECSRYKRSLDHERSRNETRGATVRVAV